MTESVSSSATGTTPTLASSRTDTTTSCSSSTETQSTFTGLAYIVGSLNLAISGNTPCESSMDHEPLKSAVKSSLSELLGVPTSRVVITGVRCAARRLQGISESEDYTLAIEYALVVDSADGGAVAVENAIESLNVAQLDASLNDELAKAGAAQIVIKVESIVAPALVQYVTSTTVTTTTGSSMRSGTRPGSVLPSA